MNRKKIAAIKNASFVTLLFLAGCGGAGDSPQPAVSGAAEQHSAAASAGSGLAPQAEQFVEDRDAAALINMESVSTCSLENVISTNDGAQHPGESPNTYKVSKGVPYTLIGFATNNDTKRVPDKIQLVLSGSKTYVRDTETGGERPDVAEYFKTPAFGHAGYKVTAAFDQIPPGAYSVIIVESDKGVQCPTHQTLTVD